MSLATPYTDKFFDSIRSTSSPSAAVIVPMLVNLLRPKSVVDVGCGEGAWLDLFQQSGIQDYLGMDGEYVQTDRLLIPLECFQKVNLTEPFSVRRSFDLAICLEVAEHLPPASAPGLVASLATCAPVVVFSAAIPHQGGTDHLNEQWPSYWADLFNSQGMQCYDILRQAIWDDERISPWYRQNILVFAEPGALKLDEMSLTDAQNKRPMSLVHPRLFEGHIGWRDNRLYWSAHPGIRESLRLLTRAIFRRIGTEKNLPSDSKIG